MSAASQEEKKPAVASAELREPEKFQRRMAREGADVVEDFEFCKVCLQEFDPSWEKSSTCSLCGGQYHGDCLRACLGFVCGELSGGCKKVVCGGCQKGAPSPVFVTKQLFCDDTCAGLPA